MTEPPRIIRRKVNTEIEQQLMAEGVQPLLARVIAGRPVLEHSKGAPGIFSGKLADLSSPFLMRDMDRAVERLITALSGQELIAIETDHDCDGQTSHAIILEALTNIFGHPREKILSFIGHRMREGYGLSDALCDRILTTEPALPSLVITADNGSSDELRIQRLKAAGMDVIVTDHHAIPAEGIPKSAYAVLNPTRADCEFPDPYVAGCMVAWLLMAATRRAMIDRKIGSDTMVSMTTLLDFVAVGTVADCVSLARSLNNRVVVQQGLSKINEFKRPCWQSVRPLLKNNANLVGCEDLGFLIGPLLNSDGRLSDALGSVRFLLAETLAEASPYAALLFRQNEERKKIQKELTFDAILSAEKQVYAGRVSLVIYLADGHAGVHGISASRIKDQFGRPAIIFSPRLDEPAVITGSCRSIDGLNIREVLQNVHEAYPDLILKFGGHKAAAGLTILLENLDLFQTAFEEAVVEALQQQTIGPLLLTDGVWRDPFDLATLKALYTLQPFGREFDEPVFEIHAYALSVRRFGQNLNHLEIILHSNEHQALKGIWFFSCEGNEVPVNEGDALHVVFSFMKQDRIELNIKYAKKS